MEHVTGRGLEPAHVAASAMPGDDAEACGNLGMKTDDAPVVLTVDRFVLEVRQVVEDRIMLGQPGK